MENNNKTQAELYREERKERLAKAAAKNAKRSPNSIKASKTAKKVIAIALAVVLCFGAVSAVLSFFDVPQKVISVSVDGIEENISLAEINYYYFQNWTQMYSTSAQYDQYGEGMGVQMTGFDYTKTPDKQDYIDDYKNVTGVAVEDLGDIENPTWEDALTYSAYSQLIYLKYGAAKAEEAGMELTEDELKAIDDEIEEIRATAKENDYSINRWLRTQVGKGVTEKLVRELEIQSHLATKFYEKYTEDASNSITEDKVNAEYAAAKDDYDIVDLRVYSFAPELESNHTHEENDEHKAEHAEAEKKAKEKADAFIKEVKDDASFVAAAKKAILTADNKSTKDPDATTLVKGIQASELKATYGEKVSAWAFDDARKVGDVAVITEESGTSYVVMMKALPTKDMSISSSDVRHLLVKFPEKNTNGSATSSKDKDGKTVSTITDDTKKVTKAEAQKILDEYLKNPTEENFIALTKKYTDDVDKNGKPNNDGLYANVTESSSLVEPFKNWALEAERKVGDVEIVETEYGYHLMYFVKGNEPSWYLSVKNKLANDIIENGVANELEEINKNTDRDSIFVKWAIDDQNKRIGNILLNMGFSHAGHNH